MKTSEKQSSFLLALGFGLAALSLAACEPEVGSAEWCEMMQDKPKGEWSANAAMDFAKHCIMTQN